jgi:hypothetical protein
MVLLHLFFAWLVRKAHLCLVRRRISRHTEPLPAFTAAPLLTDEECHAAQIAAGNNGYHFGPELLSMIELRNAAREQGLSMRRSDEHFV